MDKIRLEYEIKRNGFNLESIAKAINISRTAFYRKMTGKSEFTLSEIQRIVDVLKLDTPVGVFFIEKVS